MSEPPPPPNHAPPAPMGLYDNLMQPKLSLAFHSSAPAFLWGSGLRADMDKSYRIFIYLSRLLLWYLDKKINFCNRSKVRIHIPRAGYCVVLMPVLQSSDSKVPVSMGRFVIYQRWSKTWRAQAQSFECFSCWGFWEGYPQCFESGDNRLMQRVGCLYPLIAGVYWGVFHIWVTNFQVEIALSIPESF